ncbi:MAG: murein biosynthesis integral membrane protein MurJ [Gammaproteobacteria bacterium]
MRRGLIANLSTVGGFTLASRLLGFARDILFATHFGAGFGMDAFLVAFKIPNFGRRLFAEGAFSQAFVPVLAEYRANRSEAEVRELIARTGGSLAAVLFLLTVVGVLLAPVFIWIFAPGFHANVAKFDLSAHLLRLTFPYLLLISLTAFAGAILNTYGRFGPPAFAPALLNVAFIVAALIVAPTLAHPIYALGGAVLIAGVLQLAVQLPGLIRLRFFVRPALGFAHAGVRRILRLMTPIIFGASTTQINLLIDTIIASFLASGSISWLYYSDRLMEFPLGVFAIALGTVILPRLSHHFARGEGNHYSTMLDRALRLTLLFMPAAAMGLLALARPIVASIYGYGHFDAHDVAMARASLMAYAVGLTGFALVKVLAPAYFARQDVRTPVRIGVIAVGVNLALNVALVIPWAVLGGYAPHAGLALSTGLAAIVNATLLWRGLHKRGIYKALPGWGLFLVRIAAATLAMGAAVWFTAQALAPWTAIDVWQRVWRLAVLLGEGFAVYAVVLAALGMRPRHLRPAVDGNPAARPV